MFSRPLIPVLGATIIGILIGRSFQVSALLPAILLPSAALLMLGILYLVPFKVHPFYLVSVFILLGINSQAARPIPENLSSLVDSNPQIGLQGTIYNPPYLSLGNATFPIHTERIFHTGNVETAKINLLVKVYGYQEMLAVGDRIRISAEIREFKNFNNPGGFDYGLYMKRRGIALMAVVKDGRYVVPMGKGRLGFLDGILERVRSPLRLFFQERLSYRTQAIYSALILGERQGITHQIREPFDRSGIGHIMAVSGLHLGLVAWLFFTFFRWILSLSQRLLLIVDVRKLAAIITAVPVIGYGLITGFQLSSQRAVVMILVFLWSIIIGRERDVWSSLCLAALIILVLNADSLFTASFQLSFIAVVGILWLSPLIFNGVSKGAAITRLSQKQYFLYPVLRYVIGLIAVTTAATVMTIPLIAYHFHRFSILALPANLTVVPIIGLWAVPLGLLSSIALFISSTLAEFILSLGGAGLNLAIYGVQFWSDIPWSSIWIIRPSWLEIALFYGLLYFILCFRSARLYRVFTAVLLTILLMDIGYWAYQTRFNRSLRVTVLDVGRRNAALIQFPGKTRMIIAHNVFGPWGFHLPRIAIAPYLWHNKIAKVDYLFPIGRIFPQSDRLQFMADNFHVREVITSLPWNKSINGARIDSEAAGEVLLGYHSWSFHFSEAGVYVHKETQEIEKPCSAFLIITDGKKVESRDISAIRIAHTGALTLSVDRKGAIQIKSFLKEDLPLFEGGP